MWVTKSQATLESDCHSTNHFLSVNLWCKDLVPQKRGKIKCSECVECFGHWTVFMCWTESGLCTREYGWLRADPHWHQTVTPQISSLVLISDAKTWSHKKEEKELQWVSWIFWPLDCLYMLNREWTLYKRIWVTKSQPTLASDCHSTNLFSSLNLWCKDLVPQKRGKGIAVSDLNILATELSLYAEQRVDFVKEFAY